MVEHTLFDLKCGCGDTIRLFVALGRTPRGELYYEWFCPRCIEYFYHAQPFGKRFPAPAQATDKTLMKRYDPQRDDAWLRKNFKVTLSDRNGSKRAGPSASKGG